MNRYLIQVVALLAVVSCGGKDNPEQDPVPTAIVLSANSFTVAQAGETLSLTITAPSRPKFIHPDWVFLTDATFRDYKATYGLIVDPNNTYESREATVTVQSAGASDVTFKVTQAGKVVVPDPPQGTNEAWQLAGKLGLGWNMGNHFDAYYNGSWAGEKEGYPDEEAWGGVKATQATFNGVKAAGFTSVRIPVSWLRMIGDAPDYQINETWMNRVFEVVQYAHNAGLYVIINTHHDENHGVDNDYQWLDIKNAAVNDELNASIKAKIRAVWTQIAEKFKDCGDWLIMESFNELNDGGWGWSDAFVANPARQCNILNEWNQVFVDAVRATGGENATRWLGVPGYAANPEFLRYFKMPQDPASKMMVAFHCYDPYEYTIGPSQYSDWGHTGTHFPKGEEEIKALFSKLSADYTDRNIPVYMGEFGCSFRKKSDTNAWRYFLYYLEYVVKAAKVYGIPCFLWDNGSAGDGQEHHAYINHGTGDYVNYSKEAVDSMVKAWFTDSPVYTLQTVYESAP